MTAIVKVIDERTGRVLENEYKMPPTNIEDHELYTIYNFHFYINVAKSVFVQKEDFHGRLRRISKRVDPYSMVFENHNKLYITLSSGQTVNAEPLHERSDHAVFSWLTTIFLIGMETKKKG